MQVNTGEEPQKAGVLPAETPAFVAACRDEHGLVIDGLMCIPPVDEEPSLHFALLAKLAAGLGVKELSMGMSGDFAKAIAFGATYVRVGTAIFGARDWVIRRTMTAAWQPASEDFTRPNRAGVLAARSRRSRGASPMQPAVGV